MHDPIGLEHPDVWRAADDADRLRVRQVARDEAARFRARGCGFQTGDLVIDSVTGLIGTVRYATRHETVSRAVQEHTR